ncbi:MAG: glycosyltransferase family 4 protein [Solirubrobacteraceae bacterium]
MQIAVVGMSDTRNCGVHDHAELLADALAEQGSPCTMHWLMRSGGSARSSHAEVRTWARQLERELADVAPDVVLVHYSPFAWSHRGVPVHLAPVLAALRRSGTPVVTVLHELAYNWQRDELRGNVWALTQRGALALLMHATGAVLLTSEPRAQWLASRWWLPTRPMAIAPVFSTLPTPTPRQRPERPERVIGLFGYSYPGAALALVTDAVKRLLDEGLDVRLRLLGAPGPDSSAGGLWREQAAGHRIEPILSFTGSLPAQELSDALADCDVLLFADSAGPTSRKTTLTGSLAAGRPLIAIDGPQRWGELLDSGAALIVEPTPRALAAVISSTLLDMEAGEALGLRGRAFAESQMGVERSASTVLELSGPLVASRTAPLAV